MLVPLECACWGWCGCSEVMIESGIVLFSAIDMYVLHHDEDDDDG